MTCKLLPPLHCAYCGKQLIGGVSWEKKNGKYYCKRTKCKDKQ